MYQATRSTSFLHWWNDRQYALIAQCISQKRHRDHNERHRSQRWELERNAQRCACFGLARPEIALREFETIDPRRGKGLGIDGRAEGKIDNGVVRIFGVLQHEGISRSQAQQ